MNEAKSPELQEIEAEPGWMPAKTLAWMRMVETKLNVLSHLLDAQEGMTDACDHTALDHYRYVAGAEAPCPDCGETLALHWLPLPQSQQQSLPAQQEG